MANPRQGSAQTPALGFWRQRWKNIEPVVGAFVEDGLLLLTFLTVLTLAYLALGWLAGLGYEPERIELLGTIHYYTYLVVFGFLMLDLLIRIALHTVNRFIPETWRKDSTNSGTSI